MKSLLTLILSCESRHLALMAFRREDFAVLAGKVSAFTRNLASTTKNAKIQLLFLVSGKKVNLAKWAMKVHKKKRRNLETQLDFRSVEKLQTFSLQQWIKAFKNLRITFRSRTFFEKKFPINLFKLEQEVWEARSCMCVIWDEIALITWVGKLKVKWKQETILSSNKTRS